MKQGTINQYYQQTLKELTLAYGMEEEKTKIELWNLLRNRITQTRISLRLTWVQEYVGEIGKEKEAKIGHQEYREQIQQFIHQLKQLEEVLFNAEKDETMVQVWFTFSCFETAYATLQQMNQYNKNLEQGIDPDQNWEEQDQIDLIQQLQLFSYGMNQLTPNQVPTQKKISQR